MDDYDDIIDKIAPSPVPRKSRLEDGHLPDLMGFVQERGLQVGSTTGGRHNVGSSHYSGNAVDIHNSGGMTDAQVAELSQAASDRGFKLRDERVRPPGQKVWGGPHLHVEYAGQNPYDQVIDKVSPPKQVAADPYDEAVDKISPIAQPVAVQSRDQSILTDAQKRTAVGRSSLTHQTVPLASAHRNPFFQPVAPEKRAAIRAAVQRDDSLQHGGMANVQPAAQGILSPGARLAEMDRQRYSPPPSQPEPLSEADAATVDQLTANYKKEIASMPGGGAGRWLDEMAYRAQSAWRGLSAGGVRIFNQDAANKIRLSAIASARAAEEAGANRNKVSKFTQKIVGGLFGSAPELAAMGMGAPAPAVFGTSGGLSALGQGGNAADVARGTAHGIATGEAFDLPVLGARTLGPVGRTLSRGATVGGATSAIELAGGATPGQALETGLTNAVMAGTPELLKASTTVEPELRQTVPDETQRKLQEAESVHHSNLQPRTPEGQFDGPPISESSVQGGANETSTAPVVSPVEATQPNSVNQASGTPSQEGVPEINIPESQDTIQGQVDERGFTFVPNENKGTIKQPRGTRALKRAEGVVYYDPSRITDTGALKTTPLSDLLGHLESKSAATTEAVVARNADGTEIQSSAVSSENVPAQIAETQGRLPNTQVGVENPAGVIADRLTQGEQPNESPNSLKRPLSPTEAEALQPRVAQNARAGDTQGTDTERSIPSDNITTARGIGNLPSSQVSEGGQNINEPVPTLTPATSEATDKSANRTSEGVGEPAPSNPERTTSAQKAVVDAHRAERGAEPLPWSPETKADETLLSDAQRANEDNPRAPQELTKEVLQKPRALSDMGTLQLDLRKQELMNEHGALLSKIANTSDPATLQNQSASLDAIEQEYDDIDRAWRLSGTEKGRSLRSQQITINQNYELLPMKARMKAALGKVKLSPEIEAQIESQQKRIAELEARWKKRTERTGQQGVDKFVQETKLEVRQRGRQRTREALVTERAAIKQQVAQAFAKLKPKTSTFSMGGLGDLDPEGELTRAVGKLARNYIEDGVIKTSEIIDNIHEFLKDATDLTKRQITDLLGEYGRIRKSNNDPMEKKFREVQRIARTMSGSADVLENGIRVRRTGASRDKPTEDERHALRDLETVVREHDAELSRIPRDVETEQATPLDKAKTTARNRQEQLKSWLATGRKEVQGRQQTIPDAELKQLRAENTELEKRVALLNDPTADAKAIERRVAELNKLIREGKTRAASGNVTPELKEGASAPWSAEVGRLEKERVALNREIAKIRTEQARQARKEAAAQLAAQEKARQARIEKKLASIEQRISDLKSGKVKPEAREGAQSVWTPEISAAERKLAEAQRKSALGTSIANERAGIRSGQVRPATSESTSSIWTPEIGAMERERVALTRIASDLRAEEARKTREMEANKPTGLYGVEGSWADFEARARKALAARTKFEKQIAEYRRRTAARDYTKPPKKGVPAYDQDTENLRLEMNRAKRKFDADVFDAKIKKEWAERPLWSKGLAYGAGGVRAGVLSGVKTIGKIGSALAQRTGQQYIEEGLAKGLKRLAPKTAEKAIRYGGHMNAASEGAFARGFGSGIKEIPHIIRTGESELSQRFKDHYPGIPTKLGRALEVPGRVHFSEKNPLLRGEFERSKELLLQQADRVSPGSRNNPSVIDAAEQQAYKNAKEVILMGDNPLSRRFADAQLRMSRESRDLVRTIIPVHRVAGNYLNQMVSEYGIGLLRGSIRALHERNPEALAMLTPAEADKTMRLLQRGSLGALYMALAASGIVKLGGFYKQGRKDEVAPQDAKIGKVTIPHWALHSPPDELAQLVASMKQEWQEGKQKGNTRSQRIWSGVARSTKGVADQTPFVNELTKVTDSLRNGDSLAGWAGRFVASRVEPQILQEIARKTDRANGQEVKRKPKGFLDALKMGVPNLRQTVPDGQGRTRVVRINQPRTRTARP